MALTQVDQGLLGTYAQYTGFKNRILNGQMAIDQRNAGASITPSSGFTYSLDRWQYGADVGSKVSIQQNAGSVTPPAGFTKYLGITSLSAYTAGSTEQYNIQQKIEGFNIGDLAFGTASASTVTLSFWVRSSLTGSFSGSLVNSDGTRSYPFSYTISSANTWTQASVTIAGDTTGTWNTNNTQGMCVYFNLGCGSTFLGTAGAWTGSEKHGVTGSVSVVGTNGATFYITGVQLEKGSTATSFDYRPYGTELQLCQRYYQKTYNQGTVPATATLSGWVQSIFYATSGSYIAMPIRFPVVMRTTPTIVFYDNNGNVGKVYANAPNITPDAQTGYYGEGAIYVGCVTSSTGSVQLGAHYTASAEL